MNKQIVKVNEDLKAEIASKHSEIKALRISKALAKAEFEKKISEVESLNHEIKAYKEQNTELLKINKNLKAAVLNKDSEKEASARNDKIKVLENAKKYFENTISSMESKIQDFKAEVASKNSKIKALELSKTHIEDANFSTNNHLLITNSDLKKVKQELQAKVDSKNSELQALWNTNVLANIEIEKIKKDLKLEIASKAVK